MVVRELGMESKLRINNLGVLMPFRTNIELNSIHETS